MSEKQSLEEQQEESCTNKNEKGKKIKQEQKTALSQKYKKKSVFCLSFLFNSGVAKLLTSKTGGDVCWCSSTAYLSNRDLKNLPVQYSQNYKV